MTDLSNRKPILCLDFDGVCHSYTSGWKGADVIPDPPVPGLFEFLGSVCPYFEVHIFSSRSHQPGGMEAMRDWFITHYTGWLNEPSEQRVSRASATPIITSLLHFPVEKPPAHVSIDDRCLLFTGVWPDVEALRNFKPWNKLDVSGKAE